MTLMARTTVSSAKLTVIHTHTHTQLSYLTSQDFVFALRNKNDNLTSEEQLSGFSNYISASSTHFLFCYSVLSLNPQSWTPILKMIFIFIYVDNAARIQSRNFTDKIPQYCTIDVLLE